MSWKNIALNLLLFALHTLRLNALDCHALLNDEAVNSLGWTVMTDCLAVVGSENLSKNTSSKFWRRTKEIYQDQIENIPATAFAQLGYILTVIPQHDLRSVKMERVEIVEAFGRIREMGKLPGLGDEKLQLVAKKVRKEWVGKHPRTYSEYDLRIMGEIVCYLSESDIAALQPTAFRLSVNWIGRARKCPRLQALAQFASRSDVFGVPSNWNKYEINLVGNIINGLTPHELDSISIEHLLANIYVNKSDTQQRRLTPKVNQTTVEFHNANMTNVSLTNASMTNSTHEGQ